MRKWIIKISKKLRLRCSMAYTWLLSSSFESIGKGTRIDILSRFEELGSISIGENTTLYSRSWFNPVSGWAGRKYSGKIKIGSNVMVGYRTQISAAESIVIDDEATVAAGVVIMDHMHDYQHLGTSTYLAPISEPKPVHIGKGAFLGANCFIGPGVQVGEHAVVAANAVVTKDVPAYCVAVGNPARISRFHDPTAVEAKPSTTTEG
jgi:acetyltransferase-like isoleucine patch superfamily enzyme